MKAMIIIQALGDLNDKGLFGFFKAWGVIIVVAAIVGYISQRNEDKDKDKN